MRTQVNRYLKNKRMDRIDHALGRPVNPLNNAQTYRDHFATSNESEKAEFRASPNWNEGRTFEAMTWFHVSDYGRETLAAHIKRIGDPHRLYAVTFAPEWCEPSTVLIAAKSRNAAKYAYYIDLSDALCDLTFKDYCKCASARLA